MIVQMATQARAALQTAPSARNQYYGTSNAGPVAPAPAQEAREYHHRQCTARGLQSKKTPEFALVRLAEPFAQSPSQALQFELRKQQLLTEPRLQCRRRYLAMPPGHDVRTSKAEWPPGEARQEHCKQVATASRWKNAICRFVP